jgi:hypothetical protein
MGSFGVSPVFPTVHEDEHAVFLGFAAGITKKVHPGRVVRNPYGADYRPDCARLWNVGFGLAGITDTKAIVHESRLPGLFAAVQEVEES